MREFSSRFRAWHWLLALSIFVVSTTVLLRMTYLSGYDIADKLKAELLTFGLSINIDQARDLAHIVTGSFWDWHIYFGYLFLVLILARVAMIMKKGFDYPKKTNTHKKLVYTSYKFFYLILIIMAVSGAVLHIAELQNIPEESLGIFDVTHEILGYVVMIFIPLHIIGVVVTDIKEDKGLVSRIISGTNP